MATERTQNHAVLPQLVERPKVSSFAKAGVWDPRDASELASLSEDLDVEKIGIEINSIPDIWARPLLFEMALTDDEHLLHNRILGEWRGLLALLALKEAAHIEKLTVKPIRIPTDQDELEQGPLFIRAAANLLPTGTIDPATSWNKSYIFVYGSKAIGIASPTTLVATATDYFNAISHDVVPWFDGKRLLDPTKKVVDHTIGAINSPAPFEPYLSSAHVSRLAGWLKRLNDGLHERGASDNALIGLIEAYVMDLGFADLDDVPEVELAQQGLGMTEGIFALIDRPAQPIEIPPDLSEVTLIPSRPVQPPGTKPILIVDAEIARQWGRDESQIMVWGGKTMRTAVPTGGLSKTPPFEKNKLGNTQVDDAEVWSPQWFFKEHLYVIGRENALPGGVGINVIPAVLKYNEQIVTPILPLDNVLLNHLSVNDLAGRLRFEQHNDGVLVSLKLKLRGGEFSASRLYRRHQGEIKQIDGVPVVEVWPNFQSTSWKAYYTYYDRTRTTETFEAEPYIPGEEIQPKNIGRISDKQRVTRTDKFPEAVVCRVSGAPNEVGFILIEPPRSREPEKASTFNVGVDFGATGTHIYYKAGDNNPSPFQFEERYVQITDSPDRNLIYDNCLPAKTEQTPFLSIFRRFPEAPTDNLQPLLDSIIYFPSQKLKNDRLITYNLKWSDNANDTPRVHAFLEQVALQVAAEAVDAEAGTIGWHYSFPSAFGKKRREKLSIAWKSVVDRCAALTGIQSNTPRDQTESIAAAQYFRDPEGHKAPTEIGAVFIDVGGSTSDIAIWQKSLLWQTSILLAGRDILLDFLHDNLTFLKSLKRDIDLTPLEEAKNISRTAFYAQIDHLLRRNGKELINNLHKLGSESQKLEQVVAVGLASIFYYIGLTIKYLREREKYLEEIPSFYIGGNGSQMFYWLTSGAPFGPTSPASSLFAKAFLQASGLTAQSLSIELSKRPKAEAAFGLICGTKISATDTVNGKMVLAGEKFKDGDEVKEWDSLLDADAVSPALEVPQELEQLERFIVTYDEIAKEAEFLQIAPNARSRAILLGEVRRLLSNTIRDGEPIFILAVKALLERLRA